MAVLDQQVKRDVCEWLIAEDIQFYERDEIMPYFEIFTLIPVSDTMDLKGAAIFYDAEQNVRYIFAGMPSSTVCDLLCRYKGMTGFVYRS